LALANLLNNREKEENLLKEERKAERPDQDQIHLHTHQPGHNFVTRVTSLPVVTSIASFYEHSKSSSRILKLGAESVEQSVKAVYKPIQGLVEPQLSNFDSFGCRQLDKIQTAYPIVMEKPETMYQTGKKFLKDTIEKQIGNALTAAESVVDHYLPEAKSSQPQSNEPNGHQNEQERSASNSEIMIGRVQKIGSRVHNRLHKSAVSKWQVVYTKSQESIQGMENTVMIVRGAQNHIEDQGKRLKETLSQLQLYIETKTISMTSMIQQQANEALKVIAEAIQTMQRDIIDTLRKAIDTISRGAIFMPSYAQSKIKEFIMALPSRWATISNTIQHGVQDEQSFLSHGHQVAKFTDETVSVLKSVLDIFSQYIEKARALLQTLQISNSSTSPPSSMPSSPSDTLMATSPPPSHQENTESNGDESFSNLNHKPNYNHTQLNNDANEPDLMKMSDDSRPNSPMSGKESEPQEPEKLEHHHHHNMIPIYNDNNRNSKPRLHQQFSPFQSTNGN